MTDWLEEAEALARRGESFAVATVVRCERPTSAKPGAKALIRQDGTVSGWVGGSCAEPVAVKEALGAIEDGAPRFLVLVGKGGALPGRAEGVREYTMTCHSGGTLEIFVEPVLPMREYSATTAQALLAEYRGDTEAAATAFAQAAADWGAFGNKLEQAHALRGLHRTTGDPTALAQAEQLFRAPDIPS